LCTFKKTGHPFSVVVVDAPDERDHTRKSRQPKEDWRTRDASCAGGTTAARHDPMALDMTLDVAIIKAPHVTAQGGAKV
jgi:hypothetical protein